MNEGTASQGRFRNAAAERRWWLLLGSLAAVLLLLELGIRSYDHLAGRGFLYDGRNLIANGMRSFIPFRTFGFTLYRDVGGVRRISSRHGELYPLDKPEGTFRIVAFGGSTTVNARAFRTSGKHYPLLLERKLKERFGPRVEVINVGQSGYATPHSLILLALDVISWNPDLVILSHNNNDLFAAYWPDFRLDYSNMYSHEAFVPYHATRFTLLNALFQHSQLYWLLKRGVEGLADVVTGRGEIRRKPYGSSPPPLAARVFERNLRSFVALAQSHGIQVLLASQSLHRSQAYFERLISGSRTNSVMIFPLHEEFIAHHARFNGIMKKVADETGTWFVDNDLVLAGEDAHFADHIHYTELGIERLSDSCFEFLVESGLIG